MALPITVLIIFLCCSLVNAESKDRPKLDSTDPMYYWEKGNHGQKISREEFNILMNQIEQKLIDLKVASSKISIAGANFSYENGKIWEIELDSMRENIQLAIKYLTEVKNKPDSMTFSLVLYIVMRDIVSTAYDFDKIKPFEDTLNKAHTYLSIWSTAFQKAHLVPLAVSKDNKIALNRGEKPKD